MHDAILTICLAVGCGALLVIAGQHLKTPAIVLLLAGGILLGPEFMNLVQPETLGHGMETLVAVLVAVILFEGGITLDLDGYRHAPITIRRLLLIGPLVTCLGCAVAVWALYGVPPGFALVAGSLVIVTGPTVVSPLLRRMHINERLHHILYWEAVLIDAVGVFIAVLCFEWLVPAQDSSAMHPLVRFGLRVLTGVGIGVASGFTMSHVLKRRYITREYVNIFVLACALLTFAGAHALLSESGILAVVVSGLIVAIRRPRQLASVRQFKLQLTELAIGTLFIMLAAKLDLNRFSDPRLIGYLIVVIVLLRPLAVILATTGQGFGLRERALLSWIAPRGIVAASMASLFSLRLADMGFANPELLETLTYAVIGATVTLQGLSAPLMAKLLGLANPKRRSWILAGHPRLVLPLSQALQRAGARTIPITAIGGAIDDVVVDDARFADARGLLTLHADREDNQRVLQTLRDALPSERLFQWNAGVPRMNESGVFSMPAIVSEVWNELGSPDDTLIELEHQSSCFDVIEVGGDDGLDRFGTGIRPLFFVHEGTANLIRTPTDPHGERGDIVVALRKRIAGLSQLIADVVVVDHSDPTFEQIVETLVERVQAQGHIIDLHTMRDGILAREQSMPTALGNGVVVPHAYVDGLTESRCYVAGVPAGLAMATPDGRPIHLVFMLVSPSGQARKHLQALAAIAELAQDASLIEQLAQQRIPDRLRRFIAERA